ncbi:glycosyltransferase [Achromobacter mucicolens]|uniref:glycosyltransferase n=1 Tax=Achromobacter mucicolens TaxID=1389922 RepID=UPI00244C44C7|nr:glycosyltransferase [Achromobacter mucicolens]MDH0089861.1 glycosyltransferase [Achromobacter mucicolens]
MKILILANAQSVHVHRWLRALSAAGHDVHIATAEPHSIEGVTVHTLPQYPYQLLRLVLSAAPIRRLVSRLKPDIVHAYYLLDYGFMAAFAGVKPMVVTAMGSDVLRGLDVSRRRRFLASYACRRADYVLTRAEHMNETVRRLGANGLVKSVPNGIETGVFKYGGARNSVPRVLCTRAFRPVYNIMALVKAIAILKGSGKRADFVLVGDGPDRAEIETAIESEGLQDYVTLAGALAHEALPAYYASSDIYVSPSLSDGNSVSLMEALACGCYPVVSDIPANRSWIVDGENGRLFEPTDPQALALKLGEAIDGIAAFDGIRRQNRDKVVEEADFANCLAKVLEAYDVVRARRQD